MPHSDDVSAAVEHHARKAQDYIQSACDEAPLLTVDQWLTAAQVQATLALARATDPQTATRREPDT